MVPKKISVSVISSISEVSPVEWDACNLDSTGPEKLNPFLTHGFLSSLEESGCAVKVKNCCFVQTSQSLYHYLLVYISFGADDYQTNSLSFCYFSNSRLGFIL